MKARSTSGRARPRRSFATASARWSRRPPRSRTSSAVPERMGDPRSDPPGSVSDQNTEEGPSGMRNDQQHPEPRSRGGADDERGHPRDGGGKGAPDGGGEGARDGE